MLGYFRYISLWMHLSAYPFKAAGLTGDASLTWYSMISLADEMIPGAIFRDIKNTPGVVGCRVEMWP